MGTSDTNVKPQPDDDDSGKPDDKPDDKAAIEEKEPDRKFSQADVDKAIGERLKRERANLKELQDKAKRLDEIEAANKSEAERLADEKKAADEKAAKAEERLKGLALKNAIAMSCLKYEVADIEVVQSLIANAGVEYDDDGEPQGIDGLVAGIVKARPYLKGSKFAGSADGGRKADRIDPNDPDALGELDMDSYLEQRNKWKR